MRRTSASCVIRTTVVPRSELMRLISSIIPRPVTESSAPVGSSRKQDPAARHQRPCDRHALLLTAGKLGYLLARLVGQTHELKRVLREALHLRRSVREK